MAIAAFLSGHDVDNDKTLEFCKTAGIHGGRYIVCSSDDTR